MLFRRWRARPAQLAAIIKRQALILKELICMRASTQHLVDAVSALVTSLTASNNQIKSELDALLALQNVDNSDPEVEASAQKIRDLVAANDQAVAAAQQALTTVPQGPAGDAPANQAPAPTPSG